MNNSFKLIKQIKRLQKQNQMLRFLIDTLAGANQANINKLGALETTMINAAKVLETKEAKQIIRALE